MFFYLWVSEVDVVPAIHFLAQEARYLKAVVISSASILLPPLSPLGCYVLYSRSTVCVKYGEGYSREWVIAGACLISPAGLGSSHSHRPASDVHSPSAISPGLCKRLLGCNTSSPDPPQAHCAGKQEKLGVIWTLCNHAHTHHQYPSQTFSKVERILPWCSDTHHLDSPIVVLYCTIVLYSSIHSFTHPSIHLDI